MEEVTDRKSSANDKWKDGKVMLRWDDAGVFMINSSKYTFIFDLDDTLYDEREYVRSGFDAVDNYMASNGVHGFGNTIWSLFENGARGNTFNLALEVHNEPISSGLITT